MIKTLQKNIFLKNEGDAWFKRNSKKKIKFGLRDPIIRAISKCFDKDSNQKKVLKDNGYLIILDFYSSEHIKKKYHHLSGVFSYKMDYRKLFDWHPSYSCFYHEVTAHAKDGFTNDKNDWVATSILKKKIYK